MCCGSSLFLKSLHGTGYYLTLVKRDPGQEAALDRQATSSATGSATSSVDSAVLSVDEGISDISTHDTIINPSTNNEKFPVYPLTKFIQKFIPLARLVEEIGSDIVFLLPTESDNDGSMKNFEVLFNELDKNLGQLNITTYGLSDTTLEEVTTQPLIACFVELFLKTKSSSDFPKSCHQRERWKHCPWQQEHRAQEELEHHAEVALPAAPGQGATPGGGKLRRIR